eukprot:gene4300-5023_t
MSFKALFLVGLLVVVIDNHKVAAQDSSSEETPLCRGDFYGNCTSTGACCLWCTNTVTFRTDPNTKDPGVCILGGELPDFVVPSPDKINMTCITRNATLKTPDNFVIGAYTCSAGSNDTYGKSGKKDNKKDKRSKKDEEIEEEEVDEGAVPISKSFVYKRGVCNKFIKDLVIDFRRVMEPNTATKLQESTNNTTKDFVNVASIYGVTHLVPFSNTDIGSYMSVGKLPHGPTLNFKIEGFSLAADVNKAKLKPSTLSPAEFMSAPLVVLNNFAKGTPHIEMMSTVLQGLFPAINIMTLKLNRCKRLVLFNLDKVTGMVEFRHYKIKIAEVGISKSVKRVIQSRVNDLSNLEDISQYILDGLGESESDFEDADGRIEIDPKLLRRKATSSNQKAIKLEEIGPRMTLDLIRVEEDLFKGTILHHKFVAKTEEEKRAMAIRRQENNIEKERRKKMQQENVDKKKQDDEKKKKRKMRKEDENEAVSDDDDAEWYRKEVGEEPDSTFTEFTQRPKGMKKRFKK